MMAMISPRDDWTPNTKIDQEIIKRNSSIKISYGGPGVSTTKMAKLEKGKGE